VGTQTIESNASWQIPFGLYFVAPTIVAASIWFVPESPRWLILNDNLEQARKNLYSLREGSFTEEEIEEEWQHMVQGIEAEKFLEKGTHLDIFRGINRRRTLTIMGINFFLQGTGQHMGTTYGAVFIKSLGTVNQFYMTVGKSLMNVCISLSTQYLQDRIGRR